MYILRFVCVFCTDHEFCSLVKLKKAAMENNRSYIFQREKEVAILKKKIVERLANVYRKHLMPFDKIRFKNLSCLSFTELLVIMQSEILPLKDSIAFQLERRS